VQYVASDPPLAGGGRHVSIGRRCSRMKKLVVRKLESVKTSAAADCVPQLA
jgi:hypothetical protein